MSAQAQDRIPPYARWASAYAAGVAAAASKTAQARVNAQAIAVANRAANAKRKCGIKGCVRKPFKGSLCRAHWAMVPQEDKVEAMVACMKAQRRVAEAYHRRFLRDLRDKLSSVA